MSWLCYSTFSVAIFSHSLSRSCFACCSLSWLLQVNQFLEQLDDQAENYVEETVTANEESGEHDNLVDILASRGLAPSSEDDGVPMEDEDAASAPKNEEEGATPGGTPQTSAGAPEMTPGQTGQPSLEQRDEKESDSITAPPMVKKIEDHPPKKETPLDPNQTKPEDTRKGEATPPAPEKDETPKDSQEATTTKAPKSPTAKLKVIAPKVRAKSPPPPAPPTKQPHAPTNASTADPPRPPAPKVDPNPALVKEARESQKEVRTLRRHMVTLNKQLESVEAEVAAQRKELEQAGTQMEKDRAKAKLERDNERKRHAEALVALQAQHETTLMDQKTRMEKQMAEMSQRLRDMEQTRMQEDGNWDKELHEAVEREQLLLQKNAALE